MTGYSDEDVETAAQVLYKRDNDMVGIPWELLTERHESTKDIFRRDARAVLDAVAPSIAARALEDAASRLRTYAIARFDEHGPYDARGAAIWDSASFVAEELAEEYTAPDGDTP